MPPILLPAILFEPLHPGVVPPGRATAASAGYDLRAWFAGDTIDVWNANNERQPRPLKGDAAHRTMTLCPHERAIVPLGFRATVPAGFEAQIRARSGTALKLGLVLANGPGTIDPDYIGEWGVLVLNASGSEVRVAHGDRIAQMVLARFEVLDFQAGTVVQTTERVGGFGSTGTR
jgi:dUTP pyrophosphatase